MKKSSLFIFFLVSFLSNCQNLNKEIQKIVEGKKATVAVSVLDFGNNQSVDLNGDQKLPMQSVFKFHIALAVLDYVDEGKLKLEQKIFIKKSDLLENTWSPIRNKYPDGNTELPLSEIIRYTVAESDNNGCDLLLRLIGGTETVQNFMNSKGIKNFSITANEEEMHKDWKVQYRNFTTTNSMNELLKKFSEGKIVSEKSTAFLIKTMLGTTTGTNKIAGQLPKNTPVAHKTGSSGKNKDGLTGAENDAAIITLPNSKKYALTVFVSDSMESETENCKIISDISRKVWEYLNQK
ncbi:class A beta-lactamase, subclass A2 [Chryseobacterium sp.]|uniref:class A beta-lactamase, subclass A2 n=1 Tax=Chryseobacterium sp. TaxID=1871047 RepID=UPI0011CAF3F0|nr:class A beta-lactamase, subclass A2 [Chryseobacterium sp.]TXF78911.1 class A beta-lactamase, subclass A2 [Chryseobacterium sp.]